MSMTTPNVVWTKMNAPPDWLDKHDNAIWSSDERQLLVKGCRNCQTTLKAHTCQEIDPVDFVVFWRERGLNQTRVDALFGNKPEEELIDAAPQASVASAPVTEATAAAVNGTVTTAQESALIQPDANGEFPSQLDGALWMALLGIPQTPLNGKKAFLQEWQKSASTDPKQIRAWARQYPGCNFGSVGLKGHPFPFEVDSPEVSKRFKAQGGDFTAKLIVESSPGKGHRYYLSAPGVENISQGQKTTKYGDFSIRADREYCVSPGSIHPKTGKQYRVVFQDLANGLTPPTEQEIAFWNSERVEKKSPPVQATNAQPIIITEPGRNNWLTSKAGKARQDLHMNEDELLTYLLRLNSEECQPPLPDSEVETIAHSIAGYEIKETEIQLTQNQQPTVVQVADDLSWLDTTGIGSRPEFPRWVMEGTSLYENLAKPVSDVNSKYPELIWLPAVQVLLNRLYGNVRIEMMNLNLNIFLGSISEPGRFFKSSSCRLGHEFFKYMCLVEQYAKKLEKGKIDGIEDRTIVMQTGSSEGFGLTMQKIGTRKAILFNDELGKLTAKIGIENSSFPHDLLSWYESDYFGNTVSNANRNFAFEAGTYCFSWQFCSTTRGFNNQWSKIAGIVSGLADRMFFLLSPPEPKTLIKEVHVPLLLGAEKTGKLINRALTQGIYSVDFGDSLEKAAAEFGDPRSMNLVYKLALAIAVDLGLETIDGDAVERALALVKYRQDVIGYLAPIEAKTEEGRVQQEIVRELRQNGGKMTRRGLTRNLHSELYGSRFWNGAYCGLINDNRIREFTEMGGHGNLKKMVGIVKESVRFGDDD